MSIDRLNTPTWPSSNIADRPPLTGEIKVGDRLLILPMTSPHTGKQWSAIPVTVIEVVDAYLRNYHLRGDDGEEFHTVLDKDLRMNAVRIKEETANANL